MTQDELIERLNIIEKDIVAGWVNTAIHGLSILGNDVKAFGVGAPAPAPRRSPLADLPPGSKLTIEVGRGAAHDLF